ncbi:hypothetical protein [Streptomyces albipurpureus]|uniref:Uncharacterized protein n=1 Tax=Streptomyces albipurpureus TaxID=2897419 RepID=A0ABT0UTY9_9ACTN|nr:hypothetical protein [Streptomyces sp. CWNU-1]MCM2390686.1 hypothetical protein [Streptomyces sp. CWNU-1]
MNSAEQSGSPVAVTISDCAKEDADTVFRVLAESYASDRAADELAEHVSEGHTTVWTGTFEVTGAPRAPAGPLTLGSPVVAELQGGYWAVDRMRETLATAFQVKDEGMAAGDQEKDVQLRLESHAPAHR